MFLNSLSPNFFSFLFSISFPTNFPSNSTNSPSNSTHYPLNFPLCWSHTGKTFTGWESIASNWMNFNQCSLIFSRFPLIPPSDKVTERFTAWGPPTTGRRFQTGVRSAPTRQSKDVQRGEGKDNKTERWKEKRHQDEKMKRKNTTRRKDEKKKNDKTLTHQNEEVQRKA